MAKSKTKKKVKIVINNKMRDTFGRTYDGSNKIEINLKHHKGDKAELASTIKHELLHVNHPKMTEKAIYKKSAKTKIPSEEQSKLLAKLRGKKMNYKKGALKRKFKMKRDEKVEPGTFISKANSFKAGIAALI